MRKAFRTYPEDTASFFKEVAALPAVLWFATVALFDKAFNRLFNLQGLLPRTKRFLNRVCKVFTTIFAECATRHLSIIRTCMVQLLPITDHNINSFCLSCFKGEGLIAHHSSYT